MPPPPRLDARALRSAYEHARDELVRARPLAPGYRLFWTRGRSLGWLDLPVGGRHAVLGSHEKCDAVLEGDPSLLPRHLLIMTIALDDGPALRLLDLHTQTPFAMEDGVPRRSIVASGPVLVGMGAYVIGGVPIEESGGELRVVAAPLRPPVITEAQEMPRSLRPASLQAPSHSGVMAVSRMHGEDTSVSSLPPSMHIGQSRPRAESGPVSAMLTLRRPDRAAQVSLHEKELGLGVMIGRDTRCLDEGLREILYAHISRNHVLLLHHGGLFEAFDLCSTNGTFVEGKPVQRLVLPEAVKLSLSVGSPITMEWRRVRAPG
jgi:hypothetical protein